MNHTIQSTLHATAVLLVGVVILQGNSPEDRASGADAYRASESTPQMKATVAGHKLCYLLQTPAGEKPEDGWPLFLFLHGHGE